MKKEAIFLLLFILMISLGSSQSQQTLGGIDGFAPGTEINLTQTCSNCTYVNVTYIVLGGGQLQNISDAMERDGTFYSYNLSPTLTTSIGEYVINWIADPNGIEVAGNYNLHVRRSGVLLTTAESFLYIALAIFNLMAVVFFLFHAITLPYTDERNPRGSLTRLVPAKYLKILSVWIGYGALVWFFSIITGIANNFLSLGFARSSITNLYTFLSIVGYGLSVFILGLLLIETYKDMFIPIIKRYLKRLGNRKSKA